MLATSDTSLAPALAAAASHTHQTAIVTSLTIAARRASTSPLSFLRTAALNDVSRTLVTALAADDVGPAAVHAALAEDGVAAAVAAAVVAPVRAAAEGTLAASADVTAASDGRPVSVSEVGAAVRALEGVCLASAAARSAVAAAGAPAALAAALSKPDADAKPLLHAAGAVLADGSDAVSAFAAAGGVTAAARAAERGGPHGTAFLRLLLLHIAPETGADAYAIRRDVDAVLGPGAADALISRRSSEG